MAKQKKVTKEPVKDPKVQYTDLLKRCTYCNLNVTLPCSSLPNNREMIAKFCKNKRK